MLSVACVPVVEFCSCAASNIVDFRSLQVQVVGFAFGLYVAGLAFKHPEKYLYIGPLINPNKENKKCSKIQPRLALGLKSKPSQPTAS